MYTIVSFVVFHSDMSSSNSIAKLIDFIGLDEKMLGLSR